MHSLSALIIDFLVNTQRFAAKIESIGNKFSAGLAHADLCGIPYILVPGMKERGANA